jgi:hypothetical protein
MAMVISSTQITAFQNSIQERFDHELMEYAQRRFPTVFQAVAESQLLALVRQVRETANRFGVDRQDNLATFLDFWVMYGADFHAASWASDILSCNELHGPDKMAVLRSRVEATGVTL